MVMHPIRVLTRLYSQGWTHTRRVVGDFSGLSPACWITALPLTVVASGSTATGSYSTLQVRHSLNNVPSGIS
ncbi:hypothetical protein GLOTRDRAFT_100963 [Gloeophyllum trabeum ATCC 11539]|uniref:Uncharacterized protein n=1 Tax=Gloeophyllum trabeum (strain ATCC 11539 / FP-39264 / Madison 617) TaxID=670483 RepID=S7RIU2_GLOTA|nr:uncharacterized protein GLOTRDRAFT_100963 [Gloeophyllum trabeum ATCC 11539]EPQ52494.1 hypothetical protein GLOTRDRAFT_100963 [Gloeophyllum trabeum ATCC 11539]